MKQNNVNDKILSLAGEQEWIYKFCLPNGLTTPGPELKGQKNVMKARVIQQMNLNEKKVLDVGCAEGMFSFYMANEGANVTGIEVNKKRFDKAEFICKQLEVKNTRFILFDIGNSESWKNLDKHYDIAFCFAILHRISDPFNFIAQLSEKCETLVFEWKSPEGFLFDKVSMAFHEVNGKLDPRNIKSRHALLSEDVMMDSGEEKPYWNPTVGAVKEITSSFGYKYYVEVKVTKFNLFKVLYSYFRLAFDLITKHESQISWRRYKRVMLICSKNTKYSFDSKKRLKRPSWDGTTDLS